MRQHETADAREIAQEIALGDRLRPRPARGGPVDAVEIAERDARTADLELQGLGRVLQLLQHFGDECRFAVARAWSAVSFRPRRAHAAGSACPAPGRSARSGAPRGARVTASPYALRVDVIP